jgi:hypothetical protein
MVRFWDQLCRSRRRVTPFTTTPARVILGIGMHLELPILAGTADGPFSRWPENG